MNNSFFSKQNILIIVGVFLGSGLLIGGGLYYFLNSTDGGREIKKEIEKQNGLDHKETKTKIKDGGIVLGEVEVNVGQLGNLEKDIIVDISEKAKIEKEKTDKKLEELKKEKGIPVDEEVPQELKKEVRVFYDKTDKGELTMNKDLFYSVYDTDSFMNPEGFILDEDGNKIFIEQEVDEYGNPKKTERIDFKNSMYAKECVWMKNPLITKENRDEEVGRFVNQFKNDLKYFTEESPKFQLSGGLEYLIINLGKLEKGIKDIEWGLSNKYLNPYDKNKPYKNQEIQLENRIKDLITVRKDICDVLFNFPIDKEAPKRDLTGKITIIDNGHTVKKNTTKKNTKKGNKSGKNTTTKKNTTKKK